MNEIEKRDLRESIIKKLFPKDTFTEFFVAVSEMKVEFDFEELRVLKNVVKEFCVKFDYAAITYLCDSILAEAALPCKQPEGRDFSESKMRNEILNNFSSIFPDYKFICTEKPIGGIGRIDIYALCGDRSVIIELKQGRRNPNGQLIAYGSKFSDPILIGITEEELSEECKIEGITYFSFNELKKNVENWIEK